LDGEGMASKQHVKVMASERNGKGEISKKKLIMDGIIEKPLSKYDLIVFFVMAVFCSLCFQQGDLLHTGGSSITYLNGHILDFYEANALPMEVNNYLPSTYILFALWNIPLKLFGIVTEPTVAVGMVPILWYKLLTSLFYMATAGIMYRIGMTIGFGAKKSKLCAYVFLTSPLAFYSQFIFGQNDIFTVFFMLLGLYYYFEDKIPMFVFYFSIALTFKYFPIFIFMPLLLLKEKDIWRIIKKCFLVMIPLGAEVALYFSSPAFKTGVLGFHATGYIFNPSIEIGGVAIRIIVVAWLSICGWAYFKDARTGVETTKWGLYFSNLVLFLLFGVSIWHPQWLLFAVPFWVLTTFMNRKFEIFIFLDILMMFFFVVFSVNIWKENVDQQMFLLGILKNLAVNVNQFPMRQLFIFKDTNLLYSFISGIVLINAIFKHPAYCQSDFTQDVDRHWNLVRARFIVGVSAFVIPAFICLASTL
jgi:hypothetical protein